MPAATGSTSAGTDLQRVLLIGRQSASNLLLGRNRVERQLLDSGNGNSRPSAEISAIEGKRARSVDGGPL